MGITKVRKTALLSKIGKPTLVLCPSDVWVSGEEKVLVGKMSIKASLGRKKEEKVRKREPKPTTGYDSVTSRKQSAPLILGCVLRHNLTAAGLQTQECFRKPEGTHG